MDACVLKVKLKDAPTDVPLNLEASNYIQEFIAAETELICTYEGNPLVDGVYLTTEKKENVNAQFKKLMLRSWEKEKSDIGQPMKLNF